MQADGTWTVLVVDDDDAARAALIRCFEDDYRVLATVSVRDAMSIQDTEEVDAVLCAQRVASASGVEFFREMRISHPEAIRILITESMDHDEMIRSINDATVYQIVPAKFSAWTRSTWPTKASSWRSWRPRRRPECWRRCARTRPAAARQ